MTPQEAIAIQVFRKPLTKRFFYALFRRGWVLVPLVLALWVLTGCDEMDSQDRTAANLRDALAQAQAQAQQEPEAVKWMDDAYDLDCEEKQVTVTQRTFTKPTTAA